MRERGEAGRYHIGLGLNEDNEIVPMSWKRSPDRTSYDRMTDAEQMAEIADVTANQQDLRERSRRMDPTAVIGNIAVTGLHDTEGNEEAVIMAHLADQDHNGTHVFHPLEWEAFKEGVNDGQFD